MNGKVNKTIAVDVRVIIKYSLRNANFTHIRKKLNSEFLYSIQNCFTNAYWRRMLGRNSLMKKSNAATKGLYHTYFCKLTEK